jgi:hypothetical protein
MIGLTMFQGYSINRLDNQIKIREEECERNFLEIYVATTIVFMLLMHMFIGVFTRRYNEIDWEDDLFEIVDEIVVYNSNHSKKYNIMRTFRIIQIAFGCIGILSGRSMWKYFVGISDDSSRCAPLYEFIACGFFPFLIVSLKPYYKLCVGIILAIATITTIIVTIIISTYFELLLENKYNNTYNNIRNNICKRNIKLFIGNVPECCICYEEKCWINECGHLICKNCIPRIQNLKCPLCKSSIHLVQSYENYKKSNK